MCTLFLGVLIYYVMTACSFSWVLGFTRVQRTGYDMGKYRRIWFDFCTFFRCYITVEGAFGAFFWSMKENWCWNMEHCQSWSSCKSQCMLLCCSIISVAKQAFYCYFVTGAYAKVMPHKWVIFCCQKSISSVLNLVSVSSTLTASF